jgi:hypothetical protein
MSSFVTPLIVEPNDDQTEWTLRAPFAYWTGSGEGVGDKITVPDGFVTNFASIPKFLWSVYPPTGLYGKAAVIHDFLYANAGIFYSDSEWRKYSREQCDVVFLTAMKALGVPHHTYRLMYHAVRQFGAGHFGQPQEAEA